MARIIVDGAMPTHRVPAEVAPLAAALNRLADAAGTRIVGVSAPNDRRASRTLGLIAVAAWLAREALDIDADRRAGEHEDSLDADTRGQLVRAVDALEDVAGVEVRLYDDTAGGPGPDVAAAVDVIGEAVWRILTPIN